MLIAANKQLTSSIREHDAETADYLEFLGHKMRQDLAKQIESRIDPIRLKMFNDSSKMISAKYKLMVKRARRNIARRYRNSVNNSIAHMNYKILKAGGKKVEIRRDSDGYMVCTPFRPPTPMSPAVSTAKWHFFTKTHPSYGGICLRDFEFFSKKYFLTFFYFFRCFFNFF